MKYEEFFDRYIEPICEALARVAREQRTVGYKELLEMPEAGVPKEELKPYMWQRFLPWILDDVNVVENDAGRPLLSAVVVSQDSGLPGDGFFFNLTAKPGLVPAGATEEEKRAVHARELQCVFEEWAE